MTQHISHGASARGGGGAAAAAASAGEKYAGRHQPRDASDDGEAVLPDTESFSPASAPQDVHALGDSPAPELAPQRHEGAWDGLRRRADALLENGFDEVVFVFDAIDQRDPEGHETGIVAGG